VRRYRDSLVRQPLVFGLGYWMYSMFNPTGAPTVNGPFSDLIQKFLRDGVVVIPNYLDDSLCDELCDVFDRLEDKYAVPFQTDRRIFGVELISKRHKDVFSDNQDILLFAEGYLGGRVTLTTTLAGKIYADPTAYGSGGGWHRDSFLPQFKALAYLSDVERENGPFQYVIGSHLGRSKLRDAFSRERSARGSPRYGDADIERYLKVNGAQIETVLGKKGSVILCDTSGIHRGSPITKGCRYALTNYYQYHPKLYRREGSRVVEELIQRTRAIYGGTER